MYRILQKYRFLLLLPVFYACKEVNLGVTLPYEGKKLVIYSELSPDKNISLHLSSTYPPTGEIKIPTELSGAQVSLFENGIVKAQLVYAGTGNYTSSIKPIVGKNYFFQIKLNGYPDAKSNPIEIPYKPEKLSVEIKDIVNSPIPGQVFHEFLVKWVDTDEKNNTFIIDVEGYYKNVGLAVNKFRIGSVSDIQDGCSFESIVDGFLYKDICLTPKNPNVSVGVAKSGGLRKDISSTEKTGSILAADSYQITLMNVSDSYEQFLKTEEEPFGILRAFSTIKTRYSNITNGYGAVLAYHSTSVLVKAK